MPAGLPVALDFLREARLWFYTPAIAGPGWPLSCLFAALLLGCCCGACCGAIAAAIFLSGACRRGCGRLVVVLIHLFWVGDDQIPRLPQLRARFAEYVHEQ